MPRYDIQVPLEAIALYTVEAKTPEEAVQKVLDGNADYDSTIDHTENLDTNDWIIQQLA